LHGGQLYVGSTEDLARRLAEHRAGTASRTTALLGPVELNINGFVERERVESVKSSRIIP